MRMIRLAMTLLLLLIAAAPAAPRGDPETYILHLPGIGGEMWPDHQFVRGMRLNHFDGPIDIYDWTGEDRGIKALVNQPRHARESDQVAERIREIRKNHPLARLVVTAHSGGTGIAVWALEKLPPDVRIDCLVLISSALSSHYDLSAALAHVTGRCYALNSGYDAVVLGAGTRLLGTIDGVKEEAAGKIGFEPPPDADEKQYRKLKQFDYWNGWLRYDNAGDHIGYMVAPFVQHVLAPLALRDVTPTTQPVDSVTPATRPTTQSSVSERHAQSARH